MLKILFIISEDWYFVSHRLALAKSAIQVGYNVALLSRYTNHRKAIENANIETIDWPLDRSSKNPIKELIAIISVISSIRQFRPSIIHSVAMKPVIYSSIASLFTGLDNRIFALAGLGFVFTSNKSYAKILRPFLKVIFSLLFKGKKTKLILQNPDDQRQLLSEGVINPKNIRLIRGAGVDTKTFSFKTIPSNMPIIILPSRMLWSKGIQDFIDCAKVINIDNIMARFVLVGTPDDQNPDSISTQLLTEWHKDGVIEWWEFQSDMPNVFHQSTIVCLPTTYGEGLPKSLLEAASCGRPIVAYDVPGCREIVKDGYNGYLVQPKSIDGLVEAIILLINNYKLCVQMGKDGRKLVKKYFTQEKIAQETMAVWDEVLAS